MAEQEKLQTGIGRPVAELWFQEFQDLLNDEASGLTWFIPRTAPGIQYVSAEELEKLQRDEYKKEETEKRVASQARWLIEALRTGGELNPEQSGAGITLERPGGLSLEGKKARMRVRARVLDTPTTLYPEGYLCAGEKAAVRKALGISEVGNTSRTREVPLYNVYFGLIEGELSEINFFLTDKVNERLSEGIDLQKVDITRL